MKTVASLTTFCVLGHIIYSYGLIGSPYLLTVLMECSVSVQAVIGINLPSIQSRSMQLPANQGLLNTPRKQSSPSAVTHSNNFFQNVII